MSEPYKLLCEARELLGKAHDKIAEVLMNCGGRRHLVGVCPSIDELIKKVCKACDECHPMEPKPRHTHEKLDKLAETIRRA